MQVQAGPVAFGTTLDWTEQDPRVLRATGTDNVVDEGAPWSPPILIWALLGAVSWLPILLCFYFLLL